MQYDETSSKRRDARVSIESDMSGVEVSVPAATSARVVAETTLGSVDVGDGLTKREPS